MLSRIATVRAVGNDTKDPSAAFLDRQDIVLLQLHAIDRSPTRSNVIQRRPDDAS